VAISRAPSAGGGARLGSVPTTSSDDLRWLQDRLALLGLVVFTLAGGFYLISASVAVVTMGLSGLVSWQLNLGRAWHLLTVTSAMVLWLATRARHQLSARTLGLFDAVGTVSVCWSLAMMGYGFGSAEGMAAGLLATVHVTIARGILIPSTGSRTLWITVAAMGPLAPLAAASSTIAGASQAYAEQVELRWVFVLMEYSLWSAAATTVATVASRVVYGLNEKVREARQLGQYTLLDKIGEGGMGEVFKASHALLRRPTAIKILDSRQVDPKSLRRFEKEVQLTSMLTHPNTISIFDYGRTPDGVFYYAMEYLEGLNLEQLVRAEGRLPPARVLHILRQICGSLGEAHEAGLIHRDVKPANVFLCCRGGSPDVIKVLDFGLVKDLHHAQDASLSTTMAIAGTPLYLSPEAIAAPDKIDARSDLYALGAVGYYLLTGRPLFEADTVVEICGHHLHTAPVRPSVRVGTAFPEGLEDALLCCLEKEPSARFPGALALAERLEACAQQLPWTQARARQWWEEHGTRSRPWATGLDNATTDLVSRRTMEVDLARRGGSGPAAPRPKPTWTGQR
jgi:serine/threonine-protein kinase